MSTNVNKLLKKKKVKSSTILKTIRKIENIMNNNLGKFRSHVKEIWGSAQLIDFLMHDMLDFAVMSENKSKKKLTKTIESFCIKEVLEFIGEIFNQKLEAKEINFICDYEGAKRREESSCASSSTINFM